MQPETLKIPQLIDDDDDDDDDDAARRNGVAAIASAVAPVASALVPIETNQTRRLDNYTPMLWAVGTFAALLAAEAHGAARVLEAYFGTRWFEAVHNLSALVAALSVIAAIIAASLALVEGSRYLERWTFWKFAAALLPSMFAAQMVGMVASAVWTALLGSCWNGDGAFIYNEFQAEFFVLLTVGGLVAALAANVGVVMAWDDESESSRDVPLWQGIGKEATPVPQDNILN